MRGRLTPVVDGVRVTVLVGGVSELFQGDLDLGRVVVGALARHPPDTGPRGQQVLVEELHYGAVAVAQRLQELEPATLVLVGAVRRGRPPGTVERRRVEPPVLSMSEQQDAVGDAVTGYVGLDLLVEVATALEALPRRTVAVEVEPESVGPRPGLSAAVAAAVEPALDMVRAEVGHAALLDLADRVRALCAGRRLGPSAALRALRGLLDELDELDRHGRWGHAFACRDHLRAAIASNAWSEGMDHRDWALWWALVEEVDRLQAVEAVGPDRPGRPV